MKIIVVKRLCFFFLISIVFVVGQIPTCSRLRCATRVVEYGPFSVPQIEGVQYTRTSWFGGNFEVIGVMAYTFSAELPDASVDIRTRMEMAGASKMLRRFIDTQPVHAVEAGTVVLRVGVPMKSWYAIWHLRSLGAVPQVLAGSIWDGKEYPTAVSLMPLVGNVLFWSVGAIVLDLAVRGGIAVRRHRQGRCVVCNYDMEGISVCPECGNVGNRPALRSSTSRY